MSVEDWFALTPLWTDWLPLPMFTPGLTSAPRFTGELLTPTFASIPTFGFTFNEELLPDVGEDEDELLPEEGEDERLPDDGEEALVPELVLPEMLPEAEPELVLPVMPLPWLLVPDVPVRSLPPEMAAPPVEVPFVRALVP
jgi:hypothetical protein